MHRDEAFCFLPWFPLCKRGTVPLDDPYPVCALNPQDPTLPQREIWEDPGL